MGELVQQQRKPLTTAAALAAIALTFAASTAVSLTASANEVDGVPVAGLQCGSDEGVLVTGRTLSPEAFRSPGSPRSPTMALARYLASASGPEVRLLGTRLQENSATEPGLLTFAGLDDAGEVIAKVDLIAGDGGTWLVNATSVCVPGPGSTLVGKEG